MRHHSIHHQQSSQSYRPFQIHHALTMLTLVFTICLLAACGSATAEQTQTIAPTPTATPAPSPTATLAPTPTPTHAPPPTPRPTTAPPPVQTPPPAPPPVVTPPSVQPASPAILDLQPASMSIVGHLDCQRAMAFVCFARVLSRPGNQSNLNWFAFTNVPGHITFSPASGTLAPGNSVLITITVPFNACTPGLFFFRGPINTHTITWAC